MSPKIEIEELTQEEEITQVEKDEYTELLEEIRTNREEMKDMLTSAVQFRKQVNTIIPPTTDFKKKYLLEEKMKLIVSVFGIELDIRKQRENSLKTEIELRRKITGADKETNDADNLFRDAATLAKAIEINEGKKHPKYEEEIQSDDD